jgi:hypothetical protein
LHCADAVQPAGGVVHGVLSGETWPLHWPTLSQTAFKMQSVEQDIPELVGVCTQLVPLQAAAWQASLAPHSQPFAGLLSQSKNPALHVIVQPLHVPPTGLQHEVVSSGGAGS